MESALYDVFDGDRPAGALGDLCLDLFEEQKMTWQAAAAGYDSLQRVRERRIVLPGFSVLVHYNTGRIRSTLADVGEKSIARRPCFLCSANRPEGQKGILYRKEYLILCNPMPVFAPHFTITHAEHRPQSLAGAVGALFRLVSDFGPDFLILYNGPACGASAPDHLHFQTIPSGSMPIEKEIQTARRLATKRPGGVAVHQTSGLGRSALIFEGNGPAAVGDALLDFLEALRGLLSAQGEPMINLICLRQGHAYTALLFPRAKHRPDAFFLEGDERLAISPAVVEMGGVLVTPVERDFERLDGETVERIYREVSLPEEIVRRAIEAME